MSEYMLRVHMSSREIIRAEVNAGDFLKRIVNAEDLIRQFKFRYYIINAGDF